MGLVETLFSASQNRRHDSRIAASVQGGDNPQWFFLWRVGDQIIADQGKPQGSRGEVRAFIAPVRKGSQSIDGGQNLPDHPVNGIKIIRRDESPNLVEIVDGSGVKI